MRQSTAYLLECLLTWPSQRRAHHGRDLHISSARVRRRSPSTRQTKDGRRSRVRTLLSSVCTCADAEACRSRIAELERELADTNAENQNLRLKDFNGSQPAVSPPSTQAYSPYSTRPSPRSVHSSLSGSTTSLAAPQAQVPRDPHLADPFLELIWSGWPADLPMPAIVGSLVSAFFSSGLVMTHMIDSVKLHQALLLPPTSPGFPHPSILHAICAVTAVFVPLESLGEPYWLPDDSPSAYHAKRAKERADAAIGKAGGRHLLQICQALHLISLQSFSSAALCVFS